MNDILGLVIQGFLNGIGSALGTFLVAWYVANHWDKFKNKAKKILPNKKSGEE